MRHLLVAVLFATSLAALIDTWTVAGDGSGTLGSKLDDGTTITSVTRSTSGLVTISAKPGTLTVTLADFQGAVRETRRWADAIGAHGVNHSAAPPTDKWSEEREFETSGIRRCKAKYGLLNAMDHSVQDGNVTIGPRPAITIDWPSFLRLVAALERCGS